MAGHSLKGDFEIFMHTEVTDTETGFTGSIVARQEWEDGSRDYLVKGHDSQRWFAEDRVRPPAQIVNPTPVGVTPE